MLGLLPDNVEVIIQGRMTRIPDPVRREIDRLKALYDGFHYRELARILFVKLGDPVDDKTVKKLWQQSLVSCQGRLGLWDYHGHPDRYQARLEVVKLYYQGWEKLSISRFLRVSRPTVDAWIPGTAEIRVKIGHNGVTYTRRRRTEVLPMPTRRAIWVSGRNRAKTYGSIVYAIHFRHLQPRSPY